MSRRLATIADRIRWLIGSLGLTQSAFAARVPMAPSQLSVLLRRLDERPFAVELETVLRLADAGGVAARWLLLGEGTPFEQSDGEGAVGAPPLRNNPWFPRCLTDLQRQGFRITPDLAGWLGEVCLPLERADDLTPDVVAVLARARLQMLYGRAVDPPDYAPIRGDGPESRRLPDPRGPPRRATPRPASRKPSTKKATPKRRTRG